MNSAGGLVHYNAAKSEGGVLCLWPRMTVYGVHSELTCCLTYT
jgi:hypothetical protein